LVGIHLALSPSNVPPSHTGGEYCYILSKARRTRDATAMLSHIQASIVTPRANSSQAPAYVAFRVKGGEPLPEVEVGGVQAEGGQKAGDLGVRGFWW
jgi:hypothetical protein